MNSKIKMQLRTNRKIKSTDYDDLGFEEKPPKSHKKSKLKISAEKDHSLDEVRNITYNSKFYFLSFYKNSFQTFPKRMK